MFRRCVIWLHGFQRGMWKVRGWGRTANYVVMSRGAGSLENAVRGGLGEMDVVMEDVEEIEGVEDGDVPGYLAQFQWPS
jgi:hypothetical protein